MIIKTNSKKTVLHTLKLFSVVFSFVFFLLSVLNANAQPSGGPYGPVHKTYELPKVSGKIYYVSPDGNANSAGTEISKSTTLEVAVKKGVTGDAIILRGGVYRTGTLVFNQGLTFQPYKDEQPLLKGTFIADKWEKAGDKLWKTKWERLFPANPEDWWQRNREEKFTPLHRFNDDMVFVDGRFLQSAANTSELNDNTFYVDYAKKEIYLAFDPADKLVEITAFSMALHRVYYDVNGMKADNVGPKIKGIDFTQFADSTIFVECVDPVGLKPE